MTTPTQADVKRMQTAMLTVPGVTLPRFGADGSIGSEFWAAFALTIQKAGGAVVATGTDWDEVLLADLKRFEGLRLSAYLDTEGVPTIGYGHTGPEVRIGMPPWTKAQAEEALREDIRIHNVDLSRALPWVDDLDGARRMVLRNMAFNMGVGWPPSTTRAGKGLRSFVNTLAHVQAGRYVDAADGMRASKWARQVGPNRSGYLSDLMETGKL